jgi:hypothetical protein
MSVTVVSDPSEVAPARGLLRESGPVLRAIPISRYRPSCQTCAVTASYDRGEIVSPVPSHTADAM